MHYLLDHDNCLIDYRGNFPNNQLSISNRLGSGFDKLFPNFLGHN